MAEPDQPPASQPADHAPWSLQQAADHLGLTPNAVRQRCRRGTLPCRQEPAGWVVVGWPGLGRPRPASSQPPAGQASAERDALVAALEERIASLEQHLAERTEEIRRRDHIIAGLVESVRALPAGEPRQDAPQDAMAAPRRDDPPAEVSDSLLGRLRRLMGR